MYQCGTDKNGAQCRDIRPHLKEISPLFDIEFSYDNERYMITFDGAPFQSVFRDDMNRELIDGIRYTYWVNENGDPIAEMDAHNEKLDADKENTRNDMVSDIAKDLRKAVLKDF